MTAKEATVFIIDLGPKMGEMHQSRTQSDLDFAMRYVWEKITAIVATERKTLYVAVLGLNTTYTNNELNQMPNDGYEHISVLQPFGPMKLPDIHQLRKLVSRPHRPGGPADAVSAIVVAVQMLTTFCRHLKYIRKIVLVTNGRGGEIDTDDQSSLDEIVKKLNKDGIELVVLGVDFDDEENYNFVEDAKLKGPLKAKNEKVLKDICDRCKNGTYATMAEAIDSLNSRPQLRSVRPVPSYVGDLLLGNPLIKTPSAAPHDGANGDSVVQNGDINNEPARALVIKVERYPRVMPARVPTAGSYVLAANPDADDGQGSQDGTMVDASKPDDGKLQARIAAMVIANPDKLAAVKQARSYTVNDPDAPGGKLDVPFDELARGFEYGNTLVHISESDMNVVQLPTEPGMEILGFVPAANLPPYYSMDKSNVIVPSKIHFPSHVAFSALLQALYRTKTVAIARLVTKKGKPPILVSLFPSLDPAGNMGASGEVGGQCLVEVELPFCEDVRPYRFPPLDRVYTTVKKEEDEEAARRAVVKTEEESTKEYEDENSIENNTIGHTGDKLVGGPDGGAPTLLTRAHYLPSEELKSAMDDFVDAMWMDPNDDDQIPDAQSASFSRSSTDLFSFRFPELYNSYNPLLYRFNTAIHARALDPEGSDPVSEATSAPPAYTTKYTHPLPARAERAAAALVRLAKVAGVAKVPPPSAAKGSAAWKRKKDLTEPVEEELDLEKDLGL